MDQKRSTLTEYKSDKFTKKELCEYFGISRPTFDKLIKNYNKIGNDAFNEKSRVPHTIHNKTHPKVEKAIIKFRKKKPKYGARKIYVIFKRDFPEINIPCQATISNILKRNNLITKKRRIRTHIPQKPIVNAVHPNDVWATDFKGDFLMRDRKRIYPLTLNDVNTRFLLGIKGQYVTNGQESKKFYIRMFKEYGVPKQILCDNGKPWAAIRGIARLTWLSVWWIKLGILPVFTQPGNPQQNGVLERMHRVLKKFTAMPPGKNLLSQQKKFNSFIKEYNHYRPHEGIGDITPGSIYKKSTRKYKETKEIYDYPPHFQVRRVCRNGCIRWNSYYWVRVSTSLKEEYVGLEPIDDDMYCVWFCNFRLGYFNQKHRKIIDNFGRVRRQGRRKT